MSLDYVKFSPGFEKFMPKEYRDMVEHGPFGKKTTVSQMGTFKEILEEHPMCAGCAMTLFIRLAIIAFPNPEDTITVGTAGCGRLAISQAAIPFVYGNNWDTNWVSSGLSRGLRLRFGDKPKDVVVLAGDGGLADIGFSQVLHSWFRKEKFTTIMLDNEVYGNTGGQESGMTNRGAVLKMAPLGKKFEKMDMVNMAKLSGCAYVATVVPNNPRRVESVIKKAVLIAREVGPTSRAISTAFLIQLSTRRGLFGTSVAMSAQPAILAMATMSIFSNFLPSGALLRTAPLVVIPLSCPPVLP
jgi:pyruvate ferredoxin oxidoreductase beta subunit